VPRGGETPNTIRIPLANLNGTYVEFMISLAELPKDWAQLDVEDFVLKECIEGEKLLK